MNKADNELIREGYTFQYSYRFGDTTVRVYVDKDGNMIERSEDNCYFSYKPN